MNSELCALSGPPFLILPHVTDFLVYSRGRDRIRGGMKTKTTTEDLAILPLKMLIILARRACILLKRPRLFASQKKFQAGNQSLVSIDKAPTNHKTTLYFLCVNMRFRILTIFKALILNLEMAIFRGHAGIPAECFLVTARLAAYTRAVLLNYFLFLYKGV